MNREEQIKMWEAAAERRGGESMYGKLGAGKVGEMETRAHAQGKPLTNSEKQAAERHAQNAGNAERRIARGQ